MRLFEPPYLRRALDNAERPDAPDCPICKGTGKLRILAEPAPPSNCWCCLGTGKVVRDWTKGASL